MRTVFVLLGADAGLTAAALFTEDARTSHLLFVGVLLISIIILKTVCKTNRKRNNQSYH